MTILSGAFRGERLSFPIVPAGRMAGARERDHRGDVAAGADVR
jgi:hypothetical protein